MQLKLKPKTTAAAAPAAAPAAGEQHQRSGISGSAGGIKLILKDAKITIRQGNTRQVECRLLLPFFGRCGIHASATVLIKSEGDIMQLKLKKKEAAPAAAPVAATGAAAPAFAMPNAGGAGGMMTIELRGASIHVAEVIIRKK